MGGVGCRGADVYSLYYSKLAFMDCPFLQTRLRLLSKPLHMLNVAHEMSLLKLKVAVEYLSALFCIWEVLSSVLG